MKRASQKAVHAAADPIEPRMARAMVKAFDRMRERVSINDLAHALASKDVKRALAMLPAATVKDALAPAGTVARDAVMKGGKLGAEQVKKALEARP